MDDCSACMGLYGSLYLSFFFFFLMGLALWYSLSALVGVLHTVWMGLIPIYTLFYSLALFIMPALYRAHAIESTNKISIIADHKKINLSQLIYSLSLMFQISCRVLMINDLQATFLLLQTIAKHHHKVLALG